MYPPNLKYTSTHEWVVIDNGVATVGITGYAVEQLGEIVFLELPSVGDEAEKDSPFGAIESVKAVFDLNSPVTGEITEVNQTLNDNLDNLSTDPYGEGWVIKVKSEDADDAGALMDAAGYEQFIKALADKD